MIKKNEKKSLDIHSLTFEFYDILNKICKKNLNNKIFFSINNIFKHLTHNKHQEVFLIINKNKKTLNFIFQVSPSYKDSYYNLQKIETHIKKGNLVISLLDFYKNNFKKYYV